MLGAGTEMPKVGCGSWRSPSDGSFLEPKACGCFRFRNRIKAANRPSELGASMVPGCHCMGKPDDGKNAKKPYEKPTVTKLSPEQAKLKRLGRASEGHQGGAKGLLEMRDSKVKKRSA